MRFFGFFKKHGEIQFQQPWVCIQCLTDESSKMFQDEWEALEMLPGKKAVLFFVCFFPII